MSKKKSYFQVLEVGFQSECLENQSSNLEMKRNAAPGGLTAHLEIETLGLLLRARVSEATCGS